MIFLDSDFIIGALARAPQVRQKFEELQSQENATTTINEFEVVCGAVYRGNEEGIKKTKEVFNKLTIFGFDRNAAQKAAEIYATLKKSGAQLDAKDLFIGAIVASNNGTLLTRNLKHFERIHGLKVEKW